MNRESRSLEWVQLLILSGVHFLVDMFGNMLPAVLPAIRREFVLTLSLGSVVLASLSLSSNGVQMLTGHMRSGENKPLFLHLGMILAASVCLIPLVPRSPAGVILIIGLGVISGSGIAIAHPEGLRAVHALSRIAPELSTAVFMTSGFLGFASGGAISASLVSSFGLRGLCPLALCPLIGVPALILSRARLSVEREDAGADNSASGAGRLPFWHVMAVGLPAAISTTVVVFLVPTHLNELGFDLTFGGLSAAMFGWGGVVGPFVWAVIARRKGDIACSAIAFTLSFPFMVLYLVFIESTLAVWMLFGVGFFSMSAYILTITLARHSRGLNLGHRMAFIVGGTWGVAAVVFMALAPVAERYGTGLVLKLTPAGYLASGFIALCVMREYRRLGRPDPRASIAEMAAEEHTPL